MQLLEEFVTKTFWACLFKTLLYICWPVLQWQHAISEKVTFFITTLREESHCLAAAAAIAAAAALGKEDPDREKRKKPADKQSI